MFMPRLSHRLVLALLVLAAGCRDPKIAVYQTPKEKEPELMPPPSDAGNAAAPGIRWSAPKDWQEQTAGAMRIGSYLIKTADGRSADFSISNFGGSVGGDLANINRWRGQIQLPPISEADLSKLVETLTLPAGTFSLIDITSETALIDGKFKDRILGAWFKQPDRTWFFKLKGEAELVGSQRDALIGLLRTVEFSTTATVSPNNPPAAQAATTTSSTSTVTATADDSSLTWSAPADWAAKSLGSMRKGSYTLRDTTGAEADLSIIMFGASSNPLLANVNRWRGQLSLPPITETQLPVETTTIPSGGFTFTMIDIAGNVSGDPKTTRMLAAILYRGEEAWFFKLIGPDALVANEKTAFVEFLKTVKTR